MTIYWVSGALDYQETINPIRLRGYDDAGHLLYSIRCNQIRDHDFWYLSGYEIGWSELTTRLQVDFTDSHRFVNGFDEDGTAVILTNNGGFTSAEFIPEASQNIYAFAVDSGGWIYCAFDESISAVQLKSGVTEAQIRAVRAQVVADGSSYYHNWYHASVINGQSVYYYYNLIACFGSDIERYKRKYVKFFRVYRQNGDEIDFSAELHSRPVYAVATDSTYFYLAGEGVGESEIFFRKYDKTGTQQWEVALNRWWTFPDYYQPAYTFDGNSIEERWCLRKGLIHNILVDGSGNCYLSGHGQYQYSTMYYYIHVFAGWLRKYNSSGVLQWERRFPNHGVTNVVTDGTLFYIATKLDESTPNQYFSIPNTYSIGETAYFYDANESPAEISVWDTDGTLVDFVARNTTYLNNAYLLNINANMMGATPAERLVWDANKLYLICSKTYDGVTPFVIVYNTNVTPITIGADVLNYAQYAALSYGLFTAPFFVFDDGHNRIFSKIYQTYETYADSENFYVNNLSTARHFYRYDAAGNQAWTEALARGSGGFTNYTYRQNVEPIQVWVPSRAAVIVAPQLPALSLPCFIGAGEWEGDHYVRIAALTLPLWLSAPRVLRDYAGPLCAEIYRLYLTGTPWVELPLESFSLRRNATGRQLSVVIPPVEIALMTEIESRLSGELILFRGVVFADGTEQTDELCRVNLLNVRADRGTHSYSLTLAGAAAEASAVACTRILTGISYRANHNGLRRIRCRPDTYLAPGDIADVGAGETIIVGEISYNVNVNAATMEINELSSY